MDNNGTIEPNEGYWQYYSYLPEGEYTVPDFSANGVDINTIAPRLGQVRDYLLCEDMQEIGTSKEIDGLVVKANKVSKWPKNIFDEYPKYKTSEQMHDLFVRS
jgi:hypothetical protein